MPWSWSRSWYRGGGRGRGAGFGASAGPDAVPSLPEELVGAIMSQLTSAALTTDEHELRANSDPVQARLVQLVTCARVCQAWRRHAATSLADQRFWEQLCTNRWHGAVPPTPDYRLHYVKRRTLEKHKATPGWRDQFHLLLDLRWDNVQQPHWPGQIPGDSKFLVRSLSLRDAVIEEVDGTPAHAVWYIPGIHIDHAACNMCDSGPLALGSCVLHERGERMLELVPDERAKGTQQDYVFDGRIGRWALQIDYHTGLAELPTIELGRRSWCPVGNAGLHEQEGKDCEGIGIHSHLRIEILSTACKDDPDYVETDREYCAQVTLAFTAESLTGLPEGAEPNWIRVDKWPRLFGFLPWK